MKPGTLPYVGSPKRKEVAWHKTQPTACGSKQVPAIFKAPDSTPPSLFEHKAQHFFIAHHANHEMMIYTDGTLSNNGQIGARAGCAFVFQSAAGMPIPWNPPGGAYCTHGTYFFHLEDVGPTGKPEIPASNRAELRAVVAALGYPRTPGPTGATTALVWTTGDPRRMPI